MRNLTLSHLEALWQTNLYNGLNVRDIVSMLEAKAVFITVCGVGHRRES